jgi:predicted TIM-barrel fold metal-dependent hydrolase
MSATRLPKQKAPPLTCDCHFHIFGPYDQFPLSAGRTYSPPAALVPEYLAMAPEARLLLDQFVEWLPDAALRQRVLVDNPAKLYGF